MLHEEPLTPSQRPLSKTARSLIETGTSRFDSVDCFDFVPCNYELAWQVLDSLPRGSLCEWGSGFGIVTGLAELLGFQSSGIEIDEQLGVASRNLLTEFGLTSPITTGNYCEIESTADYYFVYCWPGRIYAMQQRFEEIAPPDAKLLNCHGQDDIRCLVREPLL